MVSLLGLNYAYGKGDVTLCLAHILERICHNLLEPNGHLFRFTARNLIYVVLR
jgi:hypothetical protein